MLFIRWDYENNTAIGLPRNVPGDHGDWFPYNSSGRRTSRAQTIQYTLANNEVHANWVGESEPIASLDEIRAAWKEILQMPLTVSDGKIFQFDRDSRDYMEAAILGLSIDPMSTVAWRLNDNSTVVCTSSQLSSYLTELKLLQAQRGFLVDAEYLSHKQTPPTIKALNAWKSQYA